MKLNIIEINWDIFRKKSIPAETPADVLESMKFVFYAGCRGTFMAVGNLASALPERVAMDVMDGIDDELEAYFDILRAQGTPMKGASDAG